MNNRNEEKRSTILYVIIGILIGIILILVVAKYTDLLSSTQVIKQNSKNKTIVEKNSISSSVEKARNSVVMVEGYQNGQLASTGTGFIYKTDSKYGYIMTNQHVIENMDKILLIDAQDNEIEGTLLGSDQYLDLAVIRIEKEKVLDVAEIGDSSGIAVGDTVFTIGSQIGRAHV